MRTLPTVLLPTVLLPTVLLAAATLAVATFTLLPRAAGQSDAHPPRVQLTTGDIEGKLSADGALALYLGVPYAAPPVGALRWRAPEPHAQWTNVRLTKDFGARPVQHDPYGDLDYRSAGFSEDCLYLNVWAPATASATADSAGLPVLVYFYGGGFVAGDASEPRYDGAAMARTGVVAVTVNYRLNVFGLFAHPELSAEAAYGASGNYALLDQAFALQWVRDNIAAFGGDPARVTIGGESAGSVSVSAQMVSPLSRDLIAGAIGESGAGIPPLLAAVPLDTAEAYGLAFAKVVGATALAELRAMDADTLYARYRRTERRWFSTVLDGYFYPDSTAAAFTKGDFADVPLLVGWNSAESGAAAMLRGERPTPATFERLVRARVPAEHADAVLAAYPHADSAEVMASATAMASDLFINFSTWRWWDLHRRHASAPTYRYLFSRVRPPLLAEVAAHERDGTPLPTPPDGAPHASEIAYVLGNLDLMGDRPYDADDRAASAAAFAYFANFVHTGDPNGEGLPRWPAASNDETGEAEVMILDVEPYVEGVDDDRLFVLGEALEN